MSGGLRFLGLPDMNLVRSMRDAGSAVALMGNHEFNALSFWHENGVGGHHIHAIRGGYLREHSFNKVAIHVKTVESYRGRKSEFLEMLDFLKTLPFYLETDAFRAQHACFDLKSAEMLKAANIRSFADGNYDELIARANDQYNEYEDSLFYPIDLFLKGPEMDLPEGMTFQDAEGVRRKRTRLRWWINPKNANLQQLSFQAGVELPPVGVSPDVRGRDFYGENERPDFFGHYWLTGTPSLIRDNKKLLAAEKYAFIAVDNDMLAGLNQFSNLRHHLVDTLLMDSLCGNISVSDECCSDIVLYVVCAFQMIQAVAHRINIRNNIFIFIQTVKLPKKIKHLLI